MAPGVRGSQRFILKGVRLACTLPAQANRRELALDFVEIENQHRSFARTEGEEAAVIAESIEDAASHIVGVESDQGLDLATFIQRRTLGCP